jgi:hypothetical protein
MVVLRVNLVLSCCWPGILVWLVCHAEPSSTGLEPIQPGWGLHALSIVSCLLCLRSNARHLLLWVPAACTALYCLSDTPSALHDVDVCLLYATHVCNTFPPSAASTHVTMQEVRDAIGSLSGLTCLEVNMNCDASELLPSLQLPANLTSISTSMLHL